MTALNFPLNPSDGDTFDNYVYDGTKGVWRIQPNVPGVSSRYQISATAPSSPINGEIWFNSNDGVPYMWYEDGDSGQWIEVGGLNGAADPFIASDTPPTGVANGTQWFDTITGNTFIYYTDADSSQWIQTSGAITGASLEDLSEVVLSTPQNGDALVFDGTNWVNEESLSPVNVTSPNEGDIMVYDGSSWINTPATSGNAIINGDFGIWQRGTSFVNPPSGYNADRFYLAYTGNATITRQTFTPGELSVPGYGDPEFYFRLAASGSPVADRRIFYRIEDARAFAGQEVTFSFWAKSSTSNAIGQILFRQAFGSGGSATTSGVSFGSTAITSSWARYSFTGTIESIAGKTVGTGSYLFLSMAFNLSADITVDLWGFQLEAGSVATPFRLAGGGSKAAELALCQRYFQKSYDLAEAPGSATTAGAAQSRGLWSIHMPGATIGNNRTRSMPRSLPVQMRATPTVTVWDTDGNINRFTAMGANGSSAATNVAFDTFGGGFATETSVGLQTVTGNATYLGAMVNYQLNAEL